MALRYGFFDSEITGYDEEGMPEFDRAESSDFLAMFIASLISDGVLAAPGDCFQVLAGEGMTLRVRPGFGVVRGRFAYDDGEATIGLEAADARNGRVDRVILRANYPGRKCEVIVRAGTPGMDPQPPGLLRANGDYHELCLAEISVRANQNAITQADITDTRADTSVCGWVTGLIDQVDTSTLFLQWQDAYRRFMEELEAKLEGDAAGRLLAGMEALSGKVQGIEEELGERPVRSAVRQAVIQADGWAGEEAPFENEVQVDGVTDTNVIEIAMQPCPTKEQVSACAKALLVDGGQGEGAVMLLAMGEKPETDIPITVIIRGDS